MISGEETADFPMRKGRLLTGIMAADLFLLSGAAGAEVILTAEPAAAAVGGVVDVTVEAGEGAASLTYTLLNNGETVFAGKEDTHFSASFRPAGKGLNPSNMNISNESAAALSSSSLLTVHAAQTA